MKLLNNFSTSIDLELRRLIEEKSKRDNVKFTSSQLANALSMPRAMITKLTHTDKTKRVLNPRIDTLLKIVEFFRDDGFDITVDDLLGITSRTIDVQSQEKVSSTSLKLLAVYSLSGDKKQLGTIEIKLPDSSQNVMALYSEENIEPLFKSGSIFIVDLDMSPSHDTLIAIKLNASQKIDLKKYYIENNKIILKPLNYNDKNITLMPTTPCEILGVVIQVNAKT